MAKQKGPRTVVVAFRTTPEVKAKMEAIARAEWRTYSDLINYVMDRLIREDEVLRLRRPGEVNES